MPLNLVRNYEPKHYTELSQRFPCRFAYAKKRKDGVHILHEPVLCRDFLLDTLTWGSGIVGLPPLEEWDGPDPDEYTIIPNAGDIYGYNFNGSITKQTTTLWVSKLPHLKENWNVFEMFVKDMGMEPTAYWECTEGYLLKGDPRWQSSTMLMSLYTWAIRNILYPFEPNLKVEDVEKPLHEVAKVIKELPIIRVACCKELDDPETYHSFSGFMSYFLNRRFTVYA